jgi:hypothetical protein
LCLQQYSNASSETADTCARLSVVFGACGSISPTIHRQELED